MANLLFRTLAKGALVESEPFAGSVRNVDDSPLGRWLQAVSSSEPQVLKGPSIAMLDLDDYDCGSCCC